MQACSAALPALLAWRLVCCLQQEMSLSAAWSSDWIDLSKCWMAEYPKQTAPPPERWAAYAERSLHQLHCPYVTEAVCKCAVCLSQLGCVMFTLHRYISCAATITEPNDFGPASVGEYVSALLGLRGLKHHFYLGISVAHDSPLLCISHLWFANSPFLLLSFLCWNFSSF